MNELQTMDGNVTMENAYEEGDVSLNGPSDRQAAQDRRHGQEPPDLSGHFPGTSSGQQQGQHPPAVGRQVQGNASGQPQGSGAPITDPGTVDNKKLREAVGGLMQALSMTISQEFSTHLDQLEMSQEAGQEILSQMVDKLSKGENPSPPGYQVRPPTATEISAAATRAAANKKAAEEADAIAKRLAKEKEEA